VRLDELELIGVGSGPRQVVSIKRGSFELHPAALSYINADDVASEARTYVSLVGLARWKVTDHSRMGR
jgi:hypothetical protein